MLRLLAIPPFLFCCFHFLYHFPELTVFKDSLLSFFFVELVLMGFAAIAALAAFSVQTLCGGVWVRKSAVFMTAWASVFLLLLYFKKWLLSFTLADEKGSFEIGRKAILVFSMGLTVALLIFLNRNPQLQHFLRLGVRRLTILIAATTLAGAFALGSSFLKGGPSHAAARPIAGAEGRPVNILLIVVDTLSANHLSRYGYQRRKTPNFDRLAEEGYFAENARANVTGTGPSISSLLSGRSPFRSHILSFEPVPGPSILMNLLTHFEVHGYKTKSIVEADYASTFFLGFPTPTEGELHAGSDDFSNRANRFLSSLCRSLGFHLKFRVPRLKGVPVASTASFFDTILKHLDGLRKDVSKPHFLYVHFMLPDRFTYGHRSAELAGLRYCHPYPPEKQPQIDEARDAYDQAVSDLDGALGDLFHDLKGSGVLKDTLVVFTADHGDSYKRGFWGHGTDLSEDTIKVPLIIYTPSKTRERLTQPVELCDIAPTILQLAGLEKPEWMDCVSALSKEERREKAVTFNLLTERSIRERVPFPGLDFGRSIAFYQNGFKTIVHPEGKRSELYDLNRDPQETMSLAEKYPDKIENMKRALRNLSEKRDGT